jgi:hypothetical protein
VQSPTARRWRPFRHVAFRDDRERWADHVFNGVVPPDIAAAKQATLSAKLAEVEIRLQELTSSSESTEADIKAAIDLASRIKDVYLASGPAHHRDLNQAWFDRIELTPTQLGGAKPEQVRVTSCRSWESFVKPTAPSRSATTPDSIIFVAVWSADGPFKDVPPRWPVKECHTFTCVMRDRAIACMPRSWSGYAPTPVVRSVASRRTR